MMSSNKRLSRPQVLTAFGFVAFVSAAAKIPAADRVVLLEKLSITWCPHCMNAAQSLDTLLDDHGDRFIPLEIFSKTTSGGRYQIPWGQSRTFSFYNLAGYPTAWFDGVVNYLGDVNAYSNYLSRVNSRLAMPTDVLVNVSARRTGARTYDVTAEIGLESTGVAKTVRVFLVEALDHFGVFDDNQTVPRNTLKQILEPGFDITLTAGQTQSMTRSITFDDDSWNQFNDIRLVAWAQAPLASAPAEVFNAAQFSFSQWIPGDFNSDGAVNTADYVVWRNNSGGFYTTDDFNVWRTHFGVTSGSGLNATVNASVPEPAMPALLIMSAMFTLRLYVRGCRKPRRDRLPGKLTI